jgi:hypothetical protein
LFGPEYVSKSTVDRGSIADNEDGRSSDGEDVDEGGRSCRFCDKTKVVKRKPRDMLAHYGLIATGNQVIKDATLRDTLSNDGHWTASTNYWTITEPNRFATSSELLVSVLTAVQTQTKRANLKPWVLPDVPGDWSFGHTNPSKVTREIATWDGPSFLRMWLRKVRTTKRSYRARNRPSLANGFTGYQSNPWTRLRLRSPPQNLLPLPHVAVRRSKRV